MSSMYNQAAVEALCSATYLSNYLDSLENLPDDLQRNITQLRELDAQCGEIMGDIDTHVEIYQSNQSDTVGAKRIMLQVQRLLLRNQEIGDEKLNLILEMIELIDNRKNQLEQDLENLDPQINEHEAETFNPPVIRMNPTHNNNTSRRDREPKKTAEKVVPVQDTSKDDQSGNKGEKVNQKRHRRKTNNHEATTVTVKEEEKKEEERPPKKKKKRKVKKDKDGFKPRIDPPIDPDEPTYCLCDQISYGEMIGCDNDGCEIEWFHFNCVNLTTKPKGKWYCPNCRGESSKVKRH